ncbi:MAG: cryptochrome/photolyase family protein [Legionellales bacterium]|nr:cryptochrome/photolyase family protein [Legionellales bacterium]
MKTLRLILGDQLSKSISSLNDAKSSEDVILMCEVWDESTYVKHHKKKIAFLFSAMRHFADTLQHDGYKVEYIQLNDKENTGSFYGEVKRAISRYKINQVIITMPNEYRVLNDIKTWEKKLNISVEIRDDDRFLSTPEEFATWAKKKKQLRMEFFYREMRKKHHILMQNDSPEGGQWNYDKENRKPPKRDLKIPKTYEQEPDKITQTVIALVNQQFADHFGDTEPFYFAVTRKQALQALNLFIQERLSHFGDYQDAMLENEPWMFHSHLSFYLNCGLLLPLECIKVVEDAYYEKKIPLNAAEGFIRQILGWREYIRGLYWLKMPDYAQENFFNAKRSLPEFYWSGDTKMNCLRQCVLETQKNAYAHHIQRLMVLGNFTLLTGIHPKYVNEWYLIVYADAYEWVELPNVTGMILFADGGYLASKPYAASGNYINKMSNYCKNCNYKISKKTGEDACPFNYLYWDFLIRNRDKLESNQRVNMLYRTYDKMDKSKQKQIQEDSQKFLEQL